VADVGAGAGYYSMRLAEIVGPEGKVFAEDISNSSIRWLNDRVKVFNLSSIAPNLGQTSSNFTKSPLS
jgi:ubiquinone/menaquinone biosynthesis C-methylase UbiE